MRRLARWLLPPVLLCAGYALWVGLTGRGPACPIHAALGLWCPLCGASRMGLALDYLTQLGRERQILLFTCHGRERAYLAGRADAACIRLHS